MNSTDIFALALGLKEPWEITDIDIPVDKDSIKELKTVNYWVKMHIGFGRCLITGLVSLIKPTIQPG